MKWVKMEQGFRIPIKSWCADTEPGAMVQAENLAKHPVLAHHVALMPLIQKLRAFPKTALVLLLPAAETGCPQLAPNVFCCCMPENLLELHKLLVSCCPRKKAACEMKHLEQEIYRLLTRAGFAPKHVGFRYLQCILLRAVYADWIPHSILIDYTAMLYGVSSERVRSAIRRATQKAYDLNRFGGENSPIPPALRTRTLRTETLIDCALICLRKGL